MCSSTAADQHFLIPGHLLPRRRDEVLEDTSFRSTDLTRHCYQPSINPVYSREHKAHPRLSRKQNQNAVLSLRK